MRDVMQGTSPQPILTVLEAQGRKATWLARTTGYRPEYLSRIFNGHLPATVTVRAACAKALGMDEASLFHSDSTPEKAA